MKVFFPIIILLSQNVFAISFLSENNKNASEKENTGIKVEFNSSKKMNKVRRDSVSYRQHSTSKLSDSEFQERVEKRTDEFGEKITKTLDAYYSGPVVLENTQRVRTLDQFDGYIKDSVLVTQSPESIIVYAKDPTGPLYNSKLRCMGSVFVHRVKIACDLLITQDKDYPVRVLIREKHDGVTSLLPDKIYTGEEARFLKSSAASILAGFIDVGKDRVLTDNGEQELINMKNKLYGGAFDAAKVATTDLKQNSDEVVTAVLNSGREVRIEFLEGVKGEL